MPFRLDLAPVPTASKTLLKVGYGFESLMERGASCRSRFLLSLQSIGADEKCGLLGARESTTRRPAEVRKCPARYCRRNWTLRRTKRQRRRIARTGSG